MFKKIDNDKRIDKIVEVFNGDVNFALEVEMTVYAYASKFINEYNGGRWHYLESDKNSKVFAMAWDNDEEITITNAMNYSESVTDSYSGSLAVYAMALNHLGYKHYEKGNNDKANNLFNMQENVMREIYDEVDNAQQEEVENPIDFQALHSFLD